MLRRQISETRYDWSKRTASRFNKRSKKEDFDDIDLSNRITSASVSGVNSVSGGPWNGWSNDSGLASWPSSTNEMAFIMFCTLFKKNIASVEQKDASSSVNEVVACLLFVYKRFFTADHTRRVSRPASLMR